MPGSGAGSTPIILFVEPFLELSRFATALEPGFSCLAGSTDDPDAVVALVTGSVPITDSDAAGYPNLKMVLSCSTGIDHVEVEALASRGVTVCNTPTYCTEEVADHALACLLGAWRELWTLDRAVRAGSWDPGTMLRRFDHQRLGIIGLGRIGRALARRATALGIEVVAHDPWANPSGDIPLLPLSTLLGTADAVALHAPGGQDDPPLLGRDEIRSMKPGAVLVDLARSSLVDITAVASALEDGHLSAAAFDVWEREPPDPADERLDAPGLLLTPHVGWSSPQAHETYYAQAIEALRAVLIDQSDPVGHIA